MSRRRAITPPQGERLAYTKLALDAVLYVNEAADWAHELVMAECTKPGDYLNAMRRVATRFSLPYGMLWDLHYRKPKSIGVEDYFGLFRVYTENRNPAEAKTKIGTVLLSVADEIRKHVGSVSL
jgi:hypothetical protein